MQLINATWDKELLDLLDNQLPCIATSSGAGGHLPPFGCCYRRCRNLSRASEAALNLRKCTGCCLARCVVPWHA